MENYLVVNLGLKSIRIIVFNGDGKQIYSNSKPVHSKLLGSRIEQSALEWKNHLDWLLMTLRQETSLASTISFITSTTSSSCIYGVDNDGVPTTPVMMVSDNRSDNQVQRILSLNSFQANSGIYGYKCSTSSTVPKILWFKDIEFDIYNKTVKWLGAGEFIHYYFTNLYVTDPLNASKAFHNGKDYDMEIFKDLGLTTKVLPEVVPVGSELKLSSEVMRKFGFNDACGFVVTTYDAICAVIGSYDGLATSACDVSGTVTSVRVLTEEIIKSDQSSVLLSQELGIENKRLIGASNNLGGGIIEWCKQAFYDENDKNVYYDMEYDAHCSSTGAKGLVFLPYLLGERAPFKSVNARGTFFGISRYTKKEDFTRAVFESTAFVTNDLLNLIQDAGLNVQALCVSGGLAQFDFVNQIKADVTSKQVKVLENIESTSVGAFILMAIAIGKYSNLEEASNAAVRVRKIISPSETNHEIYKGFYSLFKSLNDALQLSYNKQQDLIQSIENYSFETLRNL